VPAKALEALRDGVAGANMEAESSRCGLACNIGIALADLNSRTRRFGV